MPTFKGTIPYTHYATSSSQGDWEMELEVDFEYSKWSEPRPYGDTIAREHFIRLTVTDVRTEDGKPFDEVPERHQIILNGLISELEDSDDFYEAVQSHLQSL